VLVIVLRLHLRQTLRTRLWPIRGTLGMIPVRLRLSQGQLSSLSQFCGEHIVTVTVTDDKGSTDSAEMTYIIMVNGVPSSQPSSKNLPRHPANNRAVNLPRPQD
jgi:hypothetical protein